MRSRMCSVRRRALTLIELVIVVAILAILAGLVAPLVDYIRRAAGNSSNAHGMAGAGQNIELYKTLTGKYPRQFDSLLDSTDTTKLYSGLNPSASLGNGGLVAGILEANSATSFTTNPPLYERNMYYGGLTSFVDNNPAATYGGDSSVGSTPRTIAYAGASDFPVALVNTATSQGQQIVDLFLPEGLPASPNDVKLVAAGIGPRLSAIGKTMQACPVSQVLEGNPTDGSYNRFVAIFSVKRNIQTSGAQLIGIIDAQGRGISTQLKNYNEVIPDN